MHIFSCIIERKLDVSKNIIYIANKFAIEIDFQA